MSMMLHRILLGDVMKGLASLPDLSVQAVITSPPYLWQRDYDVKGQIGLEATVEEYIQKIVEVSREVRRVLRDDGVYFLNLGDSYNGSGKGPTGYTGIGDQEKRQGFINIKSQVDYLKPKDMVGMPWRVVLAPWWFLVVVYGLFGLACLGSMVFYLYLIIMAAGRIWVERKAEEDKAFEAWAVKNRLICPPEKK